MKIKNIGTLAATALITASLNIVQAEDGKKPAAKKNNRLSREAIVKRFDKDGDGKLNETERNKALPRIWKNYHYDLTIRADNVKNIYFLLLFFDSCFCFVFLFCLKRNYAKTLVPNSLM